MNCFLCGCSYDVGAWSAHMRTVHAATMSIGLDLAPSANMTIEDLHTTEALHLRDLILKAKAQLERAGFPGESLEQQLEAVLERARQAEECGRQLATAQRRITELEGQVDHLTHEP